MQHCIRLLLRKLSCKSFRQGMQLQDVIVEDGFRRQSKQLVVGNGA